MSKEKKRKSTLPANYWDDEIPYDQMTWRQKLQSLTFIRAALLVFAASAALFLIGITISIIFAGEAGIYIGIFGILAFFVAVAGVVVALYGHFIVQDEGKKSWLVALLPNLAMAIFLLVMYVIGANS